MAVSLDSEDYYERLGLTRDATDDEIRRAYRKLAREYHPDRNPGDEHAEARFKSISEAHDVLGDPEKKQWYDGGAAYSEDDTATDGTPAVDADPYVTPSEVTWYLTEAQSGAPEPIVVRLSNRLGRGVNEFYPAAWSGPHWAIADAVGQDQDDALCDFIFTAIAFTTLATGLHIEKVSFVVDDRTVDLTIRFEISPRSTASKTPPIAPPPPHEPPKPPRTTHGPPRSTTRPTREPSRPPPGGSPPTSTASRRVAAALIGAVLLLAAVIAVANAKHGSSRATTSPTISSATAPRSTSTATPPASGAPQGTNVATALPVVPGIEETGDSGTVAYGEGSCGPEQGQFWKASLNRGDRVTIVWGGPSGSAMGLDVWPPGTTNIDGSGEGRVAYQSTAGEHTVETFTAPATGVYPIVIDDSCGSPGKFHFTLTAAGPPPKLQQKIPSTPRRNSVPELESTQRHEAVPPRPQPNTTANTPSAPPSPQVEGGNQTHEPSVPAQAPKVEGQSQGEGNNGVEGGAR
jgi:hypothetical protein